MLPLSGGRGWFLFWQGVASTDEQRDLAQWGIHTNILLVPDTWHFNTLPQKLMQLKKPANQGIIHSDRIPLKKRPKGTFSSQLHQ